MQIKATILENGRPLRWAYVEHIVFGAGTGMYITDSEGKIRNTNFDQGIDSFTSNADIRIICQNPVLRILDGAAFNVGVYQDKSITGGDTVDLNTATEQRYHYLILNLAQVTYEVLFKPLSFFQDLPDPEFPLGRQSSLRATRDQARRIDLSYPDGFWNEITFVEPKRLGDNYPLMHIKDRANAFNAGRLFGEDGADPSLIPSELVHALHFAFLSEAQRGHAQDKYITFIASSLAAGATATHDFSVPTTAEVAYIEAADWFALRFAKFMRPHQGGDFMRVAIPTPALYAEFVAQEWGRVTESIIPRLPVLFQFRGGEGGARGGRIFSSIVVAARDSLLRIGRLLRRPTVTGGDVEGAVYSAIFVDFASFVGLDFAASAYFQANALTFGQYRNFINDQHPEHAATLEKVRTFWRL